MNRIFEFISDYSLKILLPAAAIAVLLWAIAMVFQPGFRTWGGVKFLGELVIKLVITVIAVTLFLFGPFVFMSWLSGGLRFQ
jgi:hypothetical protein